MSDRTSVQSYDKNLSNDWNRTFHSFVRAFYCNVRLLNQGKKRFSHASVIAKKGEGWNIQ